MFEYKIVIWEPPAIRIEAGTKKLNAILNDMGEQNWELIWTRDTNQIGYVYLFFKREKLGK